jgi:hypothetical protein
VHLSALFSAARDHKSTRHAPCHEDELGEWRFTSTHSSTSPLDGSEWSASRRGRFIPREIAPGTHWIGGGVGPRTGLDAVVKRKITSLRRDSNPDHPIVHSEEEGKSSTHLSMITYITYVLWNFLPYKAVYDSITYRYDCVLLTL